MDRQAALFAALPLGCVLACPEATPRPTRTLVVHGYVPRALPSLDRLRRARRVTSVAAAHFETSSEDARLVQDVLWSDPCEYLGEPVGVPNDPRGGAGCLVGDDAVASWMKREKLHRLVRSHETVSRGAEKWALKGGRERWTVFSCSNYPNCEGTDPGSPETPFLRSFEMRHGEERVF